MENIPPVYNNPPVIVRPRRSGRGWMFLSIILGMLLIFSLLGNLIRSVTGVTSGSRAGRQSGQWMEEVKVEDNNSPNKILVIDVEGVITSQAWDRSGRNMVDFIEDQLKMAAEDAAIKSVILKVDSPGGEVMASDDISRAILDFQDKEGKPVIAAMGGMAASGGYYVSAPCRWIVANDLTLTGSIGVIMHSFNYRGLLDKVGLYPQVFKSGRFKDMLSGTKRLEEIQPEEHKMLQSIIDETYNKFKNVVATGRKSAKEKNKDEGRSLVSDWEQYADGRVLTGKQAFEYGFVDEKGNFDTAVARAKKIAGIGDANIVRFQEPFNFSSLFNILGKAEATTVKVDLGMEVPKLQAGRLYFLSQSVIQ